jgi:TolA-binding protein
MMAAAPLAAQTTTTTTIEGRVDRIEKELRAVQRKVFPGGAGQIVQPDITTPAATPDAGGSPATSPVLDLTARVNAVEAQLATLTGQVEQSSFKLRQLEAAFAQYRADIDARLAPAPAPAPAADAGADGIAPAPAPVAAPPARTPPAKAAPVTPPPVAPAPASEARKAAVAAIERPDTGNAALDAYTYGYRLWSAKFFPEAQVQLKTTVDKFGASDVASRAQNLLGRAYLDDGKPALASVAFYENYQKRPKGDRAADSLTWLGDALIQLGKPKDACKVYEQLDQDYGAALSASLKAQAARGRSRAKCGA